MDEKLRQLLKGLAEDVRPEVKAIESKIATTQNHYGDYMRLLSVVCEGKPENYAKLIAASLVIAGANRQGVADAMKLLYP